MILIARHLGVLGTARYQYRQPIEVRGLEAILAAQGAARSCVGHGVTWSHQWATDLTSWTQANSVAGPDLSSFAPIVEPVRRDVTGHDVAGGSDELPRTGWYLLEISAWLLNADLQIEFFDQVAGEVLEVSAGTVVLSGPSGRVHSHVLVELDTNTQGFRVEVSGRRIAAATKGNGVVDAIRISEPRWLGHASWGSIERYGDEWVGYPLTDGADVEVWAPDGSREAWEQSNAAYRPSFVLDGVRELVHSVEFDGTEFFGPVTAGSVGLLGMGGSLVLSGEVAIDGLDVTIQALVTVESSLGHCLLTPPDTSEGWAAGADSLIAGTSGSKDYVDIFGSAPSSGDLLVLVAQSQGAPGVNAPTITGFTQASSFTAGSPSGTGWSLLYYRVADGSEGSSFSFSGWDNASGSAYDFLHGLLLPAGSYADIASSDATVAPTSTPPTATAGWDADQKVSIFAAIVTTGSTAPSVPSGFTSRVLRNFVVGGTSRRVAIAELQSEGDSASPGNWATSGQCLTFMVRGTHDCAVPVAEETLSPTVDVIATVSEVLENGEEFEESPDAEVEVVATIAEAISFSDTLTATVEVAVDVNETALPFIVDSVASDALVDSGGDWVLDRSSTFAAGDQEYAIITFLSTTTAPTASGWTVVASDLAAGSRPGLAILTRTMSGGEGSTFNGAGQGGFPFGDVLTCHHIVVRNVGGSVGTTQGSTRNPPSQAFTPSPHDNSPALLIEAIGISSSATVNSYSSGFTEILTTDGGSLNLGTAEDVAESSPGDPGIISISVSASNAICGTLVITGT